MKVVMSFLRFLRSLFWFLSPWLALVAAAIMLVPLDTRMPGTSHEGPLPPLTPGEQAMQKDLRRHVEVLAGSIGERNMSRPDALQAAASYVETQLRASGLAVTRESYEIDGDPADNLIATLPGQTRPDEVVLVGAHYDSVFGSPGANDNASGVAAMLCIARALAAEQDHHRTIRFVAFVNEEPPYFQTEAMGSRVHARRAKTRGDNIVAMLSLETIGYYSEQFNSQYFPFHLGFFYPWTGDFLGFVADRNSRNLLFDSVTAFRRHADFPSEGLSAPTWITGVDWSDHWSFWEEGYAAVMITDTAPFRYPHYHAREDTPDKLCYDCLARVTGGLIEAIRALSQ